MLVEPDGHVTTIAVDPAWHRHGIGTRLLVALGAEAIARGAQALTLEVRLSNWARSRCTGASVSHPSASARATTRRRTRTRWSCGRTRSTTPSTRELLDRSIAASPAPTHVERAARRDMRIVGDRSGSVLAIETSCDETAAAVVDDGGRNIVSSVVARQVDLHAPYGGVVPEIASRAHVELVNDVIARRAGRGRLSSSPSSTRSRPVTAPGSRARCSSASRAAQGARARDRRSVRRREPSRGAHVRGAARGARPRTAVPHAHRVGRPHADRARWTRTARTASLGQTVDDAAGEAFDKVARFLGLGYPGGPAIDRLAATGDPTAIALPRPMLDEGYDFSFSGLKTAVATARARHIPTASSRRCRRVVPGRGRRRARHEAARGPPTIAASTRS